eukprot:9603957-Alexandrium_andersonii.AAC.1
MCPSLAPEGPEDPPGRHDYSTLRSLLEGWWGDSHGRVRRGGAVDGVPSAELGIAKLQRSPV